MITLKTLTEASSQEVFDQIARHLLTQKEKSENYHYNSDGEIAGGNCVYRSDSGLSCAAGCLIGGDEYDPRMEGQDWYCLASTGIVPNNKHKNLICALQNLHDIYSVDEWFHQLDLVTETYGLSASVLEEFR